MIRTFHSVGQGGFYTEEFSGLRIVYDCGSDSGEIIVQKEITGTFEEGVTVHAVFISHLDRDHINGLKFLLNHCEVLNVFLPLLTAEEKVATLLHHLVNEASDPFIAKVISDPQSAIAAETEPKAKAERKSTRVILVRAVEDEEDSGNVEENVRERHELTMEELSGDQLEIDSGVSIKSEHYPSWVFIPFNFHGRRRAEELKKELDSCGLLNLDEKSVLVCWKDDKQRKLLIDAYGEVTGSFNTNSMTLYSGPDLHEGARFLMLPISLRHHHCYHRAGCLYLGDYDAKGPTKWKQLHSRYARHWDLVEIIQIPHHGSKHNFNKQLNFGPVFSIISCGSKNRHRHPHASTIRDIVLADGIPIIVNEFVGSRAVFEVWDTED